MFESRQLYNWFGTNGSKQNQFFETIEFKVFEQLEKLACKDNYSRLHIHENLDDLPLGSLLCSSADWCACI